MRSWVRIQSETKFHGFQIEQKTKLPLFSRAHKSLDFNILTKIFLLNFITQRCLMIEHNSQLINFLVKYTTIRYCHSKGVNTFLANRLKSVSIKREKTQNECSMLEYSVIEPEIHGHYRFISNNIYNYFSILASLLPVFKPKSLLLLSKDSRLMTMNTNIAELKSNIAPIGP